MKGEHKLKIRAEMGRQRTPLLPREYQSDKVVELPNTLFAAFIDRPLDRYEFIRGNTVEAHQYDGFEHCLLVLAEGRADGVLVQCGEDGRADYTAYITGARDIVQTKLDRIADHIIRQGIERTASGGWCVYGEELEELFGVTIREGNGLDAMMRETLERRPEVARAEVGLDYIQATFRPEFCPGLRGRAAEKKPDIRVRDILPLLTGNGLTFLCHEDADRSVLAENLHEMTAAGREDHTALLDARVSEIASAPEGTEVVLTDVAPEELARFNEAYEAFMDAEQAMGPAM